MSIPDPIATLRSHLDEHGVDDDEFQPLLAEAWESFAGSSETSMAAHKLARLESPGWNPPMLTFVMERHGGTVLGSTRAAAQPWTVDLDKRSAEAGRPRHRQIKPMRKPLNVEAIADRIAEAIIAGRDDDLLKWSAGRTSVRVLTSSALNPDNASNLTVAGRRKRLNGILVPKLVEVGWFPGKQTGQYTRANQQC